MSGFYRRLGAGGDFFDQWDWGFSLAWELDFWGRFRRAVQAADARLNASVEDYDGVLVTLLGDVANNYVIVRTDQERIRLLQQNIAIQQAILTVGEDRLRIGQTTSVNVEQLRSNLLQNEAQVEQLHVGVRQAANRLCILMGIPPQELAEQLGNLPIPLAPADIAIGIPADLVRRRPDVRRAERLVAAQAEQIGIAEAELYPAIFVSGTLGYQARQFPDLFSSNAFNGSVGPSFQWNILNYGRLLNNIRLQDATLQEAIAAYQQTVLSASAEVEDGVVTFLRPTAGRTARPECHGRTNGRICHPRATPGGSHRFQPIRGHPTEPDSAARSVGPGTRRNRTRSHPGVSSSRWRLGNPATFRWCFPANERAGRSPSTTVTSNHAAK